MILRFVIFFVFICNSLYSQKKNFISEIIISGNKITTDDIISRELLFKIDSNYSKIELENKIKLSQQNLKNLNLFNFIEIERQEKNNLTTIYIKLIERWYIWPYPIFEFADRNFNSWIDKSDFNRVNYGLFFNWENFRGKNQLLRIKSRFGFKEHYQLMYDIPYVNDKKTFGVKTNIEYFRRKTTFFNTTNNQLDFYSDSINKNYTSKDFHVSANFSLRKNIYATHNLNLSYFQTEIDKEISELNEKYLNNNKSIGSYAKINYLYTLDKRDYNKYPLNGHYLMIELSNYIPISSDVNHFEVIGKIEKHITFQPRLHFGTSFKFKTSNADDLFYFAQKSLGFEDYIRGYEYYVIDNQKFVISKSILKWCLVKEKKFDINILKIKQFQKSFYSIYISVFSDYGYTTNKFIDIDNPNDLSNKSLWGNGISIDYLTYYDKLLRIEYSINHLGEKGVFLHISNPF
tara:strand:+ start:3249 stop:4628 length:1380 start_codon:yes stop_codon:yes gene_type:complete